MDNLADKEANYGTAKRLANTLFNPLESENIIKLPGASPLTNALLHGGGLATGYGGLFFLLRKIQKHQKNKALEGSLESYVSAAHPHLPTPIVEDKEATVNMFGPGTHPAHLSIALGLTILGAAGGHRLADYTEDLAKSRELDEDIKKSREDIQKTIKEEYARTRGLDKSANDGSHSSFVEEHGISGSGSGAELADIPRALKSGYILYAAAAAALAYRAAKVAADKKSDIRKKMKKFQDASRQMAKSKKAPVIEARGTNALGGKDKSLKSVSLPNTDQSTAQAEVDKDDPYSDLLKG
jgi:hypothetical protein